MNVKWKVPARNSASLSMVGENSPGQNLRVMAAVEQHLNPTYAQHLALKSVYEKRQYITSNGW